MFLHGSVRHLLLYLQTLDLFTGASVTIQGAEQGLLRRSFFYLATDLIDTRGQALRPGASRACGGGGAGAAISRQRNARCIRSPASTTRRYLLRTRASTSTLANSRLLISVRPKLTSTRRSA